jgi:oxaloacetate decarboxylase gamma subunit
MEVYLMTIWEMLEQSMILTVLGMAVVFAFLWLMIICVGLTGKLIHKMGWDKDIPPSETAPSKHSDRTAKSNVVAAISAAIRGYRKTEKERDD